MEEQDIVKQEKNKEYNDYVEKVTPKYSCAGRCAKAFVVGGAICTFGQFLMWSIGKTGLDKDMTSLWTTLLLVLTSVILTGLNIYPYIAKYAGAGTLVPITGFANSVVAPAMEFTSEGFVFGVGCKIFTICGPVILYGILSSWGVGIIYWAGKMTGLI